MLCVPIQVNGAEAALADALQAAERGADIIELRIDGWFDPASPDAGAVRRLVESCPLPVIVTCRASAEGGFFEGDEADRVALLRSLMATGPGTPACIDIEAAALDASASVRAAFRVAAGAGQEGKPRLILSMHDLQGLPMGLWRRLAAMDAEPAASVLKVAFRARSLRDALTALELPGQPGRPVISIAMGEFGLLSRVLAPKVGGFLTFATLRAAGATAPGQPTIDELLGQYRFRRIGRSTRTYGIVGWPVGHSLSPLVHNAGFESAGFDGVYLPLPIAAEGDPEDAYVSFKATMLELIGHERLDFCGASVTLPHKQNLVRLAREQGWGVDSASAACGAANTLVIERGREVRCRVMNTDAQALVAALESALPVAGRRVLVLGGGGAARAAVWGLCAAGGRVLLAARDGAQVQAILSDVRAALPACEASAVEWNERGSAVVDAVVNCTPVGMSGGPAPDEAPIDIASMPQPPAVVMDTVYRPLETPLLRAARGAGVRTVDGLEMFVRQAEAQFGLWTGRGAPEGLFRSVCTNAGGVK